MTVKEAIRQARELRPNALEDSTLVGWVYELEGKLAETRHAPPPVKRWPQDQVLSMPPPVDGVYVAYLCAMIDYAIQEPEQYANDMVVFNEKYDEAAAWWRRRHWPGPQDSFRTM